MTRYLPLILASFILHWTALPGTYVVERDGVAVDTFRVSVAGACSSIINPPFDTQWSIKGRALRDFTRSGSTFHALAIDWSTGMQTATLFEGRGALPYTLVKVYLPAREWTCTYAFQDSVPVWVRCTCDFDVTGAGGKPDGIVNLSDCVKYFSVWRDLSQKAAFTSCYQLRTKEWGN